MDIVPNNLKLKDLHNDVKNLKIETILPQNDSRDNFCLDMGTTPLATERLYVEEIENNMEETPQLQFSKSNSRSPEINQELFKKNIKLKNIMLDTSYEISGHEVMQSKHSYEQVSNEELESELVNLQKSFEQIIPDSIISNKKKRKDRKKKNRNKRKSKKQWNKPKKLIKWNSKEVARNKNNFEIEDVFNTNRSDFGDLENETKDKFSNCMCKAF